MGKGSDWVEQLARVGEDAPRAGGGIGTRDLIECLGTPMFSLDVLCEDPLDVVFTGINAAERAATGLVEADLVGLRPAEALPARSAANVMANYRRCVEARAPVSYDEGFDGPEGERWFRTTLTPRIDASGRVAAIVGSAFDITEHKHRADEDARTIGRLRRLSEEVRTFVTMAAHDVRSPLATVESLVELILGEIEAGAPERAEDLVRACGETAQSARGQMDELLRHANALGVREMPATETDLGRVGRDISAVIDAQGRLAMSWPRDVVRTDAVTLQLVLRNLMTNAALHCRGRIAVTMEPDPRGGPLAAFTVSDDGPGFGGADPFAAGDALSRHDTVHGFGLSAARYLIESRGGEIGVLPHVPGGAVRFTFPCRVVPGASGP